jgi:hypothetical protein
MSLLPFCEWLANTEGSIALHESIYMYTLVESVHVLTLCLFVGMAVIVDLRLLGVSFRRVPASQVLAKLEPLMVIGFIIMVITGALLVYAIPVRSYQNIFFRVKLAMIVLAGLNVFVFHRGVYRKLPEWDHSPVTPRAAKRAGVCSLVLWACVIITGRFIAYNWYDCEKPQSGLITWAEGCTPGQSEERGR